VRALGSLSRMKDQASEQQAILGAALAEGRFEPGALTALTTAQAQQASDLVSFRSSATPEESWALTRTLAGPQAGQARAVEQRVTAAGDGALSLDARQQWQGGMSYTVGWMRHAERQLTSWIAAYAQALQRSAKRSAMITGGVALAAIALAVLATLILARSIVRPLRRLEAAALDVAEVRLPAEIRALGAAGSSGPPLPVTPIDVVSTDEIGQVARAFDQVHREAVRLAGEEAQLRGSVSAIFAGFFRRSHSLLERMLRLIDSLELREDDPERLASLFQMDHLATRMRRSSDSALVLAGHETPRLWTEPVTLVDVLRAAVSEIEQYDRIHLDVQQGVSVSESAAADTVHMLAELLENAATHSPATTQVIVCGHTVRGGLLISIVDEGQGIPEDQLRQLNGQLAHPPLADVAVTGHMGLFAVAHLAARHGIKVTLELPPNGGTTARLHLPATLISKDARRGGWPGQIGEAPKARVGGRAGPEAAAADPRRPAPRFAAGPEPAIGPEPATGPEIAVLEAVPVPLSAPLPASAQAAAYAVAVPEPAGAKPGGALPIFESVEAAYSSRTRDQDLLRPGEPQASQPTPAGESATAPAAWASVGGRRAAASDGIPAIGGLTAAGLPQRIPQTSLVPGAGADREARQATAAESAQIALDRLASFQRVPLAASERIQPDHLEMLSATISGFISLAHGAGRIMDGGTVTQGLVAMERGTLVIMAINESSSLAVFTTAAADLDLVAYEMTMLLEQADSIVPRPAHGAVREPDGTA
jgi:signal transduction histidine kinase/predicted regulator of Ras-like GTPase activity (Roadblock/LC7/MglB family)